MNFAYLFLRELNQMTSNTLVLLHTNKLSNAILIKLTKASLPTSKRQKALIPPKPTLKVLIQTDIHFH